MNQKKQPKQEKSKDDLALTPPNFTSPALLFLVLLIPVVLGVFYSARDAREEETPVKAETPVVESPPVAEAPKAFVLPPGEGLGRSSGRGRRFGAGREACNYSYLVGLKPDRDVILSLKQKEKPYRILPPGSMMTMDHNPERINLDLDGEGTIRKVWCG